MPGIDSISEKLKRIYIYLRQMSEKAWQRGQSNQGLIIIVVVSVVLYLRLIDLWKAGLPYLYYTDEWHILQPVVYFLTNQTLDLEPFLGRVQTIFEMVYCPGYRHALTYSGFIIHPFLRFFGIIAELDDYTNFYYKIIFLARVANIGFLSIAFFFIYRSARLLRLPLAGIVTILQVSVSYPVLRMAGYGKAECFTMMLVAISFYFFLKFWKRGYSQTDFWYTLIFGSFAFCAKITAVSYVVPIALLSTFMVLRTRPILSSLRVAGVGLLLAIITFVALAPYTPVYAWDMVVKAFSFTNNSSGYTGGAIQSISRIPDILVSFSDFLSSYKLLIISLVLSLFFLFTTDRLLSMASGLVVISTCIMFSEAFLKPVFSYLSVPVYSVISLCMWYFLLKAIRVGKSFLERKSRRFKSIIRPLSVGLGLILLAYLVDYYIRDAEHFYKFPYSYDIEHYAHRYDSIKWLDGQLPLGAKIVFGSRSPKPNPYLYNTYNRFNMRYNLKKYRKLFSKYDYVFTGYGPVGTSAATFVRDAQIKMPRGLLRPGYNEFFSTGNANGVDTPYSKIAKNWLRHYSEEPLQLYHDWEAFLGDSLIKNGLFREWDTNRVEFPNNFKSGGGTFLIERGQESHDDSQGSIKLKGKNFNFTQVIQDYEKVRSKNFTLFVQMKTSIPNKFGVKIYDGKRASFSAHPGTGRYEEITVSFRMDKHSDRLVAYIVTARDIGSGEDVVEVKASILVSGKWRSLEDYQRYFREWQKEAHSFWVADINVKPKFFMQWTIDWNKEVDLVRDTIPNQYFTYIPLSRIPALLPARHLSLIWPPDFRPSPDDEVIIELQNISGVVLRRNHIKIAENILMISEKLPFYETNIWGTNISNIKITYKTISQKNKVFFPYVELY